jgi:hypothetical protein
MSIMQVINPSTGGLEAIKNPDSSIMDYVASPRTVKANNTAISIVGAATSGKSWFVSYANWRVIGGAVGSTSLGVSILDGATKVYESVISKNSVEGTNMEAHFTQPIKITAGNTVTYSIDASGTTGTSIVANIGLFQR